ncbi:MAG TPA: polyamine aminopropyltransferase [Actinomycetota bacterium]|nr:polyamine aminopropyltransferase [Actinomycetota bacterium]
MSERYAGDGVRTYGESVTGGYDWVYTGNLLHREQTPYQQLEVWEHPYFGRMLLLDGFVQTTEHDEFHYHEMLVHPALASLGQVRHVLIVGGGDGGALRRALEHGPERVVQCDIDEAVTRVSRELLPSVSAGALDDPRADIVFADGAAYVEENPGSFDAIVVDSTDPFGPAAVLSSVGFFESCSRALRPGGVIVQQTSNPLYQSDEMRVGVRNMSSVFETTEVYLGAVPTYPGVVWSFTCGTHGTPVSHTSPEQVSARLGGRGIATRCYTPELHRAAFALPAYVRDAVDEAVAEGRA